MRRYWLLWATLGIAAGLLALSPNPSVYDLDLKEAVIGGDYAVVASFRVHNYGGPGFCRLLVELEYAGQRYTRVLTFFLGDGDRSFEVIFHEPTFLGGVLHVLEEASTGPGGLEGMLEASTATLWVWRKWPPRLFG